MPNQATERSTAIAHQARPSAGIGGSEVAWLVILAPGGYQFWGGSLAGKDWRPQLSTTSASCFVVIDGYRAGAGLAVVSSSIEETGSSSRSSRRAHPARSGLAMLTTPVSSISGGLSASAHADEGSSVPQVVDHLAAADADDSAVRDETLGLSAHPDDRLDRGAGFGVSGSLVDLVEVVEADQPVEREAALHV
jgi:hypothetical protein